MNQTHTHTHTHTLERISINTRTQVRKRKYSVEELRSIRSNSGLVGIPSKLSPFSGGDVICEGWIDRRRGSNGKNNNRRQHHRNSSTDETTTTTNTSVSDSNADVQSNNKKNDTEWRRSNDNTKTMMMNAERRKQWRRIATGFGRVTVRKNSWGFIRCLKSEPMLIDAPKRIFFHMNHSTKDQENLYIKLNDFVAFSIEEDRKTKNLNAVNVRRADPSECPEAAAVIVECDDDKHAMTSKTNKMKKKESDSDVMNWRESRSRDPTPSTSNWRHFRRAGDVPVRNRRPHRKYHQKGMKKSFGDDEKNESVSSVVVVPVSKGVDDDDDAGWEIAGAKRTKGRR